MEQRIMGCRRVAARGAQRPFGGTGLVSKPRVGRNTQKPSSYLGQTESEGTKVPERRSITVSLFQVFDGRAQFGIDFLSCRTWAPSG